MWPQALLSEPHASLPQVQERFLADGNDRLKLLVLLCGEDDEKVQNAAAGALAMLTAAHQKLCLKMTQVVREGPGDRRGALGNVCEPRPRALCGPSLGGGGALPDPCSYHLRRGGSTHSVQFPWWRCGHHGRV